jgi:hypothetical protein
METVQSSIYVFISSQFIVLVDNIDNKHKTISKTNTENPREFCGKVQPQNIIFYSHDGL